MRLSPLTSAWMSTKTPSQLQLPARTGKYHTSSVLDLTRFGTHPRVCIRGVCHGHVEGTKVEVREAIPEGVPAPNGRAAPSGQFGGGAVEAIWADKLGDQAMDQASRSR